ncbi:MAG: hypothetical protein QQN63_03225 [Nitrosopumilus sp.]
MALTKAQEDYYDAMEGMFATPGYKIMIEDATAQIYQNQADALEVQTWDLVNILRGKSQALAELVNLENTTSLQKDSLEEPDDADI